MKNTKKAFTLVELIVVITILAILATVAFVSLSWYSQDAKNSKVKSDIATLRGAIETSLTKGTVSIGNLVWTPITANQINTTNTVAYTTSTWAIATGALSSFTYSVWEINFGALRQNGENFKDPDDKQYLVATASTGATAYYQVLWQVKNQAGNYTAVVDWNYFVLGGATAEWLADPYNAPSNWLTNGESLWTGSLYPAQ